jgi:hypothetical protein
MTSTRNIVLAQAVSDLAALLDYVGKTHEANALRRDVLSSGRVRGLEALGQLNRIRGGIIALRTSNVPLEARAPADDVVARIQRMLAQN